MNLPRSLAPLVLAAAVAGGYVVAAPSFVLAQEAEASGGAPAIVWDKPRKIVEYQLKRLSNAQLTAVERKPEAKYAPLFEQFLARKGLDRKFRTEAVDALAKVNGSDPVVVLLEALGRVEEDDKATPRELVSILMAQKPDVLAKQKEKIGELAKESDKELVKQAAYAALAAADGKPDAVWQAASEADGGTRLLLGGVPLIGDGKVRGAFFPLAKPLTAEAKDEATRVAAIEAVSAMPGHEAEAFKLLAELVKSGTGAVRDAAVRSVRRIPAAKWPKDQVAPLADAAVAVVKGIPEDKRTEAAAVQAVQLGKDLAAALPPEKAADVRKTLRELAVQTVVLTTLREQMQYDLNYFVVEAGKPVQVVLENPDAMPHNVVFTAPGAMQEVAVAGSALPPPADDKELPFVPKGNPKVLQASPLVQPDESTTLSFTAPAKPGEYGYVCTFPGHWVRMYGVMVVVDDIEGYEESPKPPTDPLNKKPFAKQKNEPLEGHGAGAGTGHGEHQH